MCVNHHQQRTSCFTRELKLQGANDFIWDQRWAFSLLPQHSMVALKSGKDKTLKSHSHTDVILNEIKYKWKQDLGRDSLNNWSDSWVLTQDITTNENLRLIQYKIMARIYYTRDKMNKINKHIPKHCIKCKIKWVYNLYILEMQCYENLVSKTQVLVNRNITGKHTSFPITLFN